MDGLSAAASIIAVIQISGTVTEYLGKVKGAAKDRQRLLTEISNITGMLFIFKDQAEEAEHDDSWDTTLRSLNMPNGPLKQFQTALEALASKLVPIDGWKKFSKPLMWPFQEKEIKDILGTIERQKALFNLARQNDHIALTKALKRDVVNIQSDVENIGKGIAQIQIDHHKEKILSWLDAPDPSLNYNNALKARHAKTGTWLVEDNEFFRWKSNAGSFLWLHGIPGCGKTILSSTVIHHVLDHCRSRSKSAVLYFYFDFNESEKQRHELMTRSLVSQLYWFQNVPSEALEFLCNRGRHPTDAELLSTLHQMMAAFDEVFMVLDALDECIERPGLLTSIAEIMRWKDINLHLLMTSRREGDIEEALEPFCDETTKICLQTAVVNADIRAYVHDRLLEDVRFKRWRKRPEVQTEIEDDLMERAGGMFRWAVCQLDTLGSCLNLPQLRKALQFLPKDLDGTYERILCKIDDFYRAYALKILQWLVFSARPLYLDEIAEVVAIDVNDHPRFDPERRLPEPRDIFTICSSLITMEDEITSGSTISIKLAHFSVKEYLVSDRIRIGKAQEYSILEIGSNAVIAQDCLAYLLHFDRKDFFEPWDAYAPPVEGRMEDRRDFPLAEYAATRWASHARSAEQNGSETTTLIALELLLTKGPEIDNWTQLCANRRRNDSGDLYLIDYGVGIAYSPLHYASIAGLPRTVEILLDEGYDANAKLDVGDYFFSPLYLACQQGHLSVVKLLLNNGADVNSKNGYYCASALYGASSEGHKEVVRLLLEYGAQVNAQGGGDRTALQAASIGGHYEVVKLLLENGADVNTQGGRYGTALQAASLRGYYEVVKLLLENGADVNAQGGEYGTALQAASWRGDYQIVGLLLENGADVNTQGGIFGTALQAASLRGYYKVIKLLLENGADVSAQGGRYNTALQVASRVGDHQIVGLLLENGADVNAQGGRYGTALQAAKAAYRPAVIQLLLENGAIQREL